MLPLYQSELLISGSVLFPVTIKNTSSTLPETFNLNWTQENSFISIWPTRFLDESLAPLTDSISDPDSYIDTGMIPANTDKLIYIEISSPAEVPQVGEYLLGRLDATTVHLPIKSAAVKI